MALGRLSYNAHRAMKSPRALIRPLVHALHAYVPGEQPKVPDLIKLNTNENPYPPAPEVLAAIRDSVDERLRLYPPPTAERLRARLARLHGCSPAHVFVGNGSDECLGLAVRTFVEPRPSSPAARRAAGGSNGHHLVQYFAPSYSLYPVLAETHGAVPHPVALRPDFALPTVTRLAAEGHWEFDAALTFVTTPNAPSGRGYSTRTLAALCRAHRGVIVLDEAYVDFADDHAMALALRHPHVLVARTFSKAYSLCFQRVGYVVGHPELIAALDKMRDSYNVNGLGQVAAEATLDHLPYYRANFKRIRATRARLTGALEALGFEVLPSQTNFILAQPPYRHARAWLEALRARKILVRWFKSPDVDRYLRITIGTDREADALLSAARRIASEFERG